MHSLPKDNSSQNTVKIKALIPKKKTPQIVSYHSSRSFTEKSNEIYKITELLDNICQKSLNNCHKYSNSSFVKQIDELNLKFYLETEKYLSEQVKDQKCQSSLFVILFKQISIYIEEIERLNLIISEKKYEGKSFRERMEENLQRQKEFKIKEDLIQTLKESKNRLEKSLSNLMIEDNNLRLENQKLKKENELYKNALNDLYKKYGQDDQRMSDLTKAGSNLSNEAFAIDSLSNNIKMMNTGKINNNCVKNNEKPFKIIKTVKEQLSKSHFIPISPTNSTKNDFSEKQDSKEPNDYVNKFLNDLGKQGKNNQNNIIKNNNKTHVKAEIIISDLEDYYNKNMSKRITISNNINTTLSNNHFNSLYSTMNRKTSQNKNKKKKLLNSTCFKNNSTLLAYNDKNKKM